MRLTNERDFGFDQRAGVTPGNSEVAAELPDAFAHTRNADSHFHPAAWRGKIEGQPDAVVSNADHYRFGLLVDFYPRTL